jgi:hypothetical protein
VLTVSQLQKQTLIRTIARCALLAMTAMVCTKIHAYAGHLSLTDTHPTRRARCGSMTTTSDSSIRLTEQAVVNQPAFKQMVAGWITSTQTSTDGQVFYGFFATIEEAQKWATNLIPGTTIEPVYHPSFNAG